ncbi:putative dehydrogenase [Hydrogenispora ethanolica]|uniref:Putative dehydrogenase n=1 Tax=Hydrogenispora ethanolica TaxID=1082276 RepID=A0A4R1S4X4_HYDET|nr:Gfo/Idh/MocA family oxidoreductase [Hydrogenispora ethanolica]TCL74288.1 putative dehydrogenase [Hydrogenispora ethanolica]
MLPLNSAIIGCGAIFPMHAEALRQLPAARLAAVVDIDKTRAAAAAEQYDCRSYADYREMLQDETIQVVHICTPHYLHAEMALAALRRGKHVLTEKPMAIELADAAAMIRTARETGRQLGICFQNRYNATSLRIKALLDSGAAGKLIRARGSVRWHRDEAYYRSGDWRGTWAMEGGGVLINQAIHTLDLLQWFGGPIRDIRGEIATTGLQGVIEVEDTAQAAITFQNGAVATFSATNCHPVNDPVEIELECERLTLKLADGLTIETRDGQIERVEEINTATGEKSYWGMSHAVLIGHFYHCLETGQSFPIAGEDGLTALQMVLAIYRSSREQRAIPWEELALAAG